MGHLNASHGSEMRLDHFTDRLFRKNRPRKQGSIGGSQTHQSAQRHSRRGKRCPGAVRTGSIRGVLKLRRLELQFAPLHHQRSIVPNTWSQSVVLTP
jgi:hypothetical protein